MNQDLEELLLEMGYQKNKGTDKYILAPEENASRKFMMDLITNSFTHYFKQLNTGEVKNFKHLRKSYITELYITKGDDAYKDSGHESADIIHKHYIDQEAVMEAKMRENKKRGKLFNEGEHE